MAEQVTVETLKDFLEAFNRHDLDSIMSFFADDCIFYMPRGARPRGDKYVGKAEVRAGLASRFERVSRMCIMEMISTGSAVIWEYRSGLSPVRLNQVSKSRCEGLICSSSLVEKLSARILSGRYWSDGRGLTG